MSTSNNTLVPAVLQKEPAVDFVFHSTRKNDDAKSELRMLVVVFDSHQWLDTHGFEKEDHLLIMAMLTKIFGGMHEYFAATVEPGLFDHTGHYTHSDHQGGAPTHPVFEYARQFNLDQLFRNFFANSQRARFKLTLESVYTEPDTEGISPVSLQALQARLFVETGRGDAVEFVEIGFADLRVEFQWAHSRHAYHELIGNVRALHDITDRQEYQSKRELIEDKIALLFNTRR